MTSKFIGIFSLSFSLSSLLSTLLLLLICPARWQESLVPALRKPDVSMMSRRPTHAPYASMQRLAPATSYDSSLTLPRQTGGAWCLQRYSKHYINRMAPAAEEEGCCLEQPSSPTEFIGQFPRFKGIIAESNRTKTKLSLGDKYFHLV